MNTGNCPPLKERVRQYINTQCIARVPSASKELPSIDNGSFYRWQFYLRQALLDPVCLSVICDDFWHKYGAMHACTPFQIAGVESASLPLLSALVMHAARFDVCLNAFSIRKQPKSYGRRNVIEGRPSELPVLLVDDLTSPQHNAFWYGVNILSNYRMRLFPYGYVVVWKDLDLPCKPLNTSIGSVQFSSLFSLSDFSLLDPTFVEE